MIGFVEWDCQNSFYLLSFACMKKDIHPKYYSKAEVSCACGHKFTIGSTKEKVEVEICSKCHPFYTGQEKLMDVVGKVDKFKKRKARAVVGVKSKKVKKEEKKKARVKK